MNYLMNSFPSLGKPARSVNGNKRCSSISFKRKQNIRKVETDVTTPPPPSYRQRTYCFTTLKYSPDKNDYLQKSIFLQENNLDVKHIPGKQNLVADALPRC